MKAVESWREVVIELNTTGFEQKGRNPDRIIEIGAIEIVDCQPGKEFHKLVNPSGITISGAVTGITGLTNKNLEGMPRFSDSSVVDELLNFIGTSRIVTHNVSLDRSFLSKELEQAKREIIPNERWIDTKKLAREKFPTSRNSLDQLCERFGVKVDMIKKHRVLVDCKRLAIVYQHLRYRDDLEYVSQECDNKIKTVSTNQLQDQVSGYQSRLTDAERSQHEKFLNKTFAGESVWEKFKAV